MAKPIPDGYHTVTPYLRIRGAADAIEFYKKAFGAEELMRLPMGDKLGHAEIRIGDSIVMLGDECAEWQVLGPQSLGGTTVGVHLYVSDVDASVKKASDAGATVTMPAQNMFWGDRMAKLSDPFGHVWTVATHTEDVSPEEMAKRMKAWGESMSKGEKK
jgi:PhnB protein